MKANGAKEGLKIMSKLAEIESKIEVLEKNLDLKRKRGGAYSNDIPSLNKLKKERDDLIAGAETEQLRDEIVYLTNKFRTLKESKHESDKKLTEINIIINYLNRNHPHLFNQ